MSRDWRNLPEKELQQISAYLDDELSGRDRARLRERIEQDPTYRAALHALQQTRDLLRELPQVPPPRNFTLTPEMAGVQPRRSWFPSRQLATVLTALLLAVVVGVDALTSSQRTMALSSPGEELRAMAPPAAEEAEAPAEGEAVQSLEEAESDLQEEPAAGQMQEPSALSAQGTGTPVGEISDEAAAPATVTPAVGARVDENGQELDQMQPEVSEPSFFAARPILRTVEFVLGLALLALMLSALVRRRSG